MTLSGFNGGITDTNKSYVVLSTRLVLLLLFKHLFLLVTIPFKRDIRDHHVILLHVTSHRNLHEIIFIGMLSKARGILKNNLQQAIILISVNLKLQSTT